MVLSTGNEIAKHNNWNWRAVELKDDIPTTPCSWEDLSSKELDAYQCAIKKKLTDFVAFNRYVKIAGVAGSAKSTIVIDTVISNFLKNNNNLNILVATQSRHLLSALNEKVYDITGYYAYDMKEIENRTVNPFSANIIRSTNKLLFEEGFQAYEMTVKEIKDNDGNKRQVPLPKGQCILRYTSTSRSLPEYIKSKNIHLIWIDESNRLTIKQLEMLEDAMKVLKDSYNLQIIFTYDNTQLGMWDKNALPKSKLKPDIVFPVSYRCQSGIIDLCYNQFPKLNVINWDNTIQSLMKCHDLYFSSNFADDVSFNRDMSRYIDPFTKINVPDNQIPNDKYQIPLSNHKSILKYCLENTMEDWSKDTIALVKSNALIEDLTALDMEYFSNEYESSNRIGPSNTGDSVDPKYSRIMMKDANGLTIGTYYMPLCDINVEFESAMPQVKFMMKQKRTIVIRKQQCQYVGTINEVGEENINKDELYPGGKYVFRTSNDRLVLFRDQDIRYLTPIFAYTIFSFQGMETSSIVTCIPPNSYLKRNELLVALTRCYQGIDKNGKPHTGKQIIYNPYFKYNAGCKSSLNKKGKLKGKNINGIILNGDFDERLRFSLQEVLDSNTDFSTKYGKKLTTNMISKYYNDYFYNKNKKAYFMDVMVMNVFEEIDAFIRFKYKKSIKNKQPRYTLFFVLGSIIKKCNIDQSYLGELYDYAAKAMDVDEVDYDRYLQRVYDGYGVSDDSRVSINSKHTSNKVKEKKQELQQCVEYFVNDFDELDDLPIWCRVFNNNGRFMPHSANGTWDLTDKESAIEFLNQGEVIAINIQGLNIVCIDCDSTEVFNEWGYLANETYAEIGVRSDGEVSAHIWFLTDDIIKTQHIGKLDILGNAKNQLVFFKGNKKSNGLPITKLPEDIKKKLQG